MRQRCWQFPLLWHHCHDRQFISYARCMWLLDNSACPEFGCVISLVHLCHSLAGFVSVINFIICPHVLIISAGPDLKYHIFINCVIWCICRRHDQRVTKFRLNKLTPSHFCRTFLLYLQNAANAGLSVCSDNVAWHMPLIRSRHVIVICDRFAVVWK